MTGRRDMWKLASQDLLWLGAPNTERLREVWTQRKDPVAMLGTLYLLQPRQAMPIMVGLLSKCHVKACAAVPFGGPVPPALTARTDLEARLHKIASEIGGGIESSIDYATEQQNKVVELAKPVMAALDKLYGQIQAAKKAGTFNNDDFGPEDDQTVAFASAVMLLTQPRDMSEDEGKFQFLTDITAFVASTGTILGLGVPAMIEVICNGVKDPARFQKEIEDFSKEEEPGAMIMAVLQAIRDAPVMARSGQYSGFKN